MNETPFQFAVSNALPRGLRVIEAYSPKLGRRLQCFGEHVFGQWVRLEADPTVQAFCERPAYLDHAGKRLVDFLQLATSCPKLTHMKARRHAAQRTICAAYISP